MLIKRDLRSMLVAGASRLILMADDGDEPPAGGGGAPPPVEPVADPPADPPPGDAPPAPEGAGDPPPPGDEPPAKPARIPWQQKRIDQLSATAKQEREAREAAEATARAANERVAAYEALYGKPPGADGAPPPPAPAGEPAPSGRALTEDDVQREAARLVQVQRLNDRCEAMFVAGSTAHGDEFTKRCTAAGQAFGQDLAQRVDFFEAVTALPNGADVYHQLVGDLDHFSDVLAMSPVQLGMELARLSTAAAVKPGVVVSKVPAPITPIDGSGGGTQVDLEEAPMEDYAKDFERRRVERHQARG